MLVLSRKKNEWITIGDNVRLVVVEIRGDKVRLGFDAPDGVSIHRQEVYDAIQRAATPSPLADNPSATTEVGACCAESASGDFETKESANGT